MSPEQQPVEDPVIKMQVMKLESLSAIENIFQIAIHDTFEFALSRAYEVAGPPDGSLSNYDLLEVSLESTLKLLKQEMPDQLQVRFANSALEQLYFYQTSSIDRLGLGEEFITVLDNVGLLEEAIYNKFGDEITDIVEDE